MFCKPELEIEVRGKKAGKGGLRDSQAEPDATIVVEARLKRWRTCVPGAETARRALVVRELGGMQAREYAVAGHQLGVGASLGYLARF